VRRNAPPLDPRETAIAQVRGLGFDPRDVRHVLPTHFDVDHVGGLSDFPDASVHVLEAELEALTRAKRPHYRSAQWAHGPRFVRHRVEGESWMGFDAVRALPGTDDEILIVPLVGHTEGHAGIAVRTAGGWLLHAGDAYFDRDEIDPVRPRAGIGISLFRRLYAVDETARRANVERLRVLARDHASEVRVFSAHCADELDAFRAERGARSATAISAV
jgi:glyoxylase-like metal-dependent hydrolase (beta-lactamase superfamily II)